MDENILDVNAGSFCVNVDVAEQLFIEWILSDAASEEAAE